MGRKLKKVVEEAGIDTRNLLMDPEVRKTLTFVSKKPNGDMDFAFYRTRERICGFAPGRCRRN